MGMKFGRTDSSKKAIVTVEGDPIEELTAINQYELSAWQDSMILKGQLFLLLDDNLTTELANFTISYYQNTGLSVSDQCSISGKDVINE